VQRFITVLSLCLAVSQPAIAKEISLNDRRKIVGHRTAVSTDKIEVETSYSKVQLNCADSGTIRFPENSRANQSAPPRQSWRLQNRRILEWCPVH
jgi:hypothetical protein